MASYSISTTSTKKPAPGIPLTDNGNSNSISGSSSLNQDSNSKLGRSFSSGGSTGSGEEMEVKVDLPQDGQLSITVDSSKAMLDLLIQICGILKLSPTEHCLIVTDPLTGANIDYKPNQSLQSLSGATLRLANKKSTTLRKQSCNGNHTGETRQQPFQMTNRITIHYPRGQKAVVLVSPEITLQALLDQAMEQKNLDPSRYQLLRPTNPGSPVDLTTTLGQYGVTEVTVAARGGLNGKGYIDGGRGGLDGNWSLFEKYGVNTSQSKRNEELLTVKNLEPLENKDNGFKYQSNSSPNGNVMKDSRGKTNSGMASAGTGSEIVGKDVKNMEQNSENNTENNANHQSNSNTVERLASRDSVKSTDISNADSYSSHASANNTASAIENGKATAVVSGTNAEAPYSNTASKEYSTGPQSLDNSMDNHKDSEIKSNKPRQAPDVIDSTTKERNLDSPRQISAKVQAEGSGIKEFQNRSNIKEFSNGPPVVKRQVSEGPYVTGVRPGGPTRPPAPSRPLSCLGGRQSFSPGENNSGINNGELKLATNNGDRNTTSDKSVTTISALKKTPPPRPPDHQISINSTNSNSSGSNPTSNTHKEDTQVQNIKDQVTQNNKEKVAQSTVSKQVSASRTQKTTSELNFSTPIPNKNTNNNQSSILNTSGTSGFSAKTPKSRTDPALSDPPSTHNHKGRADQPPTGPPDMRRSSSRAERLPEAVEGTMPGTTTEKRSGGFMSFLRRNKSAKIKVTEPLPTVQLRRDNKTDTTSTASATNKRSSAFGFLQNLMGPSKSHKRSSQNLQAGANQVSYSTESTSPQSQSWKSTSMGNLSNLEPVSYEISLDGEASGLRAKPRPGEVALKRPPSEPSLASLDRQNDEIRVTAGDAGKTNGSTSRTNTNNNDIEVSQNSQIKVDAESNESYKLAEPSEFSITVADLKRIGVQNEDKVSPQASVSAREFQASASVGESQASVSTGESHASAFDGKVQASVSTEESQASISAGEVSLSADDPLSAAPRKKRRAPQPPGSGPSFDGNDPENSVTSPQYDAQISTTSSQYATQISGMSDVDINTEDIVVIRGISSEEGAGGDLRGVEGSLPVSPSQRKAPAPPPPVDIDTPPPIPLRRDVPQANQGLTVENVAPTPAIRSSLLAQSTEDINSIGDADKHLPNNEEQTSIQNRQNTDMQNNEQNSPKERCEVTGNVSDLTPGNFNHKVDEAMLIKGNVHADINDVQVIKPKVQQIPEQNLKYSVNVATNNRSAGQPVSGKAAAPLPPTSVEGVRNVKADGKTGSSKNAFFKNFKDVGKKSNVPKNQNVEEVEKSAINSRAEMQNTAQVVNSAGSGVTAIKADIPVSVHVSNTEKGPSTNASVAASVAPSLANKLTSDNVVSGSTSKHETETNAPAGPEIPVQQEIPDEEKDQNENEEETKEEVPQEKEFNLLDHLDLYTDPADSRGIEYVTHRIAKPQPEAPKPKPEVKAKESQPQVFASLRDAARKRPGIPTNFIDRSRENAELLKQLKEEQAKTKGEEIKKTHSANQLGDATKNTPGANNLGGEIKKTRSANQLGSIVEIAVEEKPKDTVNQGEKLNEEEVSTKRTPVQLVQFNHTYKSNDSENSEGEALENESRTVMNQAGYDIERGVTNINEVANLQMDAPRVPERYIESDIVPNERNTFDGPSQHLKERTIRDTSVEQPLPRKAAAPLPPTSDDAHINVSSGESLERNTKSKEDLETVSNQRNSFEVPSQHFNEGSAQYAYVNERKNLSRDQSLEEVMDSEEDYPRVPSIPPRIRNDIEIEGMQYTNSEDEFDVIASRTSRNVETISENRNNVPRSSLPAEQEERINTENIVNSKMQLDRQQSSEEEQKSPEMHSARYPEPETRQEMRQARYCEHESKQEMHTSRPHGAENIPEMHQARYSEPETKQEMHPARYHEAGSRQETNSLQTTVPNRRPDDHRIISHSEGQVRNPDAGKRLPFVIRHSKQRIELPDSEDTEQPSYISSGISTSTSRKVENITVSNRGAAQGSLPAEKRHSDFQYDRKSGNIVIRSGDHLEENRGRSTATDQRFSTHSNDSEEGIASARMADPHLKTGSTTVFKANLSGKQSNRSSMASSRGDSRSSTPDSGAIISKTTDHQPERLETDFTVHAHRKNMEDQISVQRVETSVNHSVNIRNQKQEQPVPQSSKNEFRVSETKTSTNVVSLNGKTQSDHPPEIPPRSGNTSHVPTSLKTSAQIKSSDSFRTSNAICHPRPYVNPDPSRQLAKLQQRHIVQVKAPGGVSLVEKEKTHYPSNSKLTVHLTNSFELDNANVGVSEGEIKSSAVRKEISEERSSAVPVTSNETVTRDIPLPPNLNQATQQRTWNKAGSQKKDHGSTSSDSSAKFTIQDLIDGKAKLRKSSSRFSSSSETDITTPPANQECFSPVESRNLSGSVMGNTPEVSSQRPTSIEAPHNSYKIASTPPIRSELSLKIFNQTPEESYAPKGNLKSSVTNFRISQHEVTQRLNELSNKGSQYYAPQDQQKSFYSTASSRDSGISPGSADIDLTTPPPLPNTPPPPPPSQVGEDWGGVKRGKGKVENSLTKYQNQSQDPREALMIAIRQAAGGSGLRKTSQASEESIAET